ncbi:hypothetical protein VB741_05425 [Leptothoe sp. PORK10 BA2]|nr:hypothetical protein [Leptothoe sp. PORK10 BA2]
MNNPLTLIDGNLAPMAQYAHELKRVFKLYQSLDLEIPQSIQVKLDAIDLDFIFQDIPNILRSMRTGTKRLEGMIKGLQDFAHLDQSAEKTIDIHQALDRILLMINYRLKSSPSRAEIMVAKDYGFSLNIIECYPQLLNQALFQVLTNAIDAIDEKCGTTQMLATIVLPPKRPKQP